MKTSIKKGDKVEVIAGNHKGKTGTVERVSAGKTKEAGSRVIVEGVRMLKKHRKPTQQDQEGGIVEEEGPIHISNLKKIG